MTRRVLVVDDDEPLCRLLCRRLRELGCEAAYALSATAALRKVGREEPDLILLDIRLGGTSGLRLLGKIRERNPTARIVMITAHADLKTVQEALKLGAHDYVAKPVGKEVLQALLSDYLP